MSGGEALLMVAAILMSVAFGFTSLAGWLDHGKRCADRCERRGEAFKRASGVCTCRDGTSWVWQEGYSFKLGGAK